MMIMKINKAINNNKTVQYVLFLGILVVSVCLSLMTLSVGHSWGDDFATYIMQAQSIVLGNTEELITHNTFTIENSTPLFGAVTAPWGFPILLAPFYYFFGLNLFIMKMINVIFYLLFLLSSLFLLKKRLKPIETFLIISILAFHPMLIFAQNLIQSDIPHLFFATTCILIIDNISTIKKPLASTILLGFLIFVAYEIRAAGLLLLVLAFLCQLFNIYKERINPTAWKKYIYPYLLIYPMFFVMVFIISQILPDKSNYINQVPINSLLQTVANSLYSYLMQVLPSYFFGRIFFFCLLPFCFIGMIINIKKDFPFVIYILLTLALNLLAPNQQGGRYLYPILLFLIYFIYQGIKASSFWLEYKSGIKINYYLRYSYLILFMFGSLFLSIRHANQNLANNRIINGPYSPMSAEMFKVLSNKTDPDSIIGFYKPRAMRLITNRDSFTTEQCEKIPLVDYFVISKLAGKQDQVPLESLDECQLGDQVLTKLYENPEFIIYKVNP